ncbi:MAG: multidrug transporter [Chlamydiae bacterium RIFCSPHIGHO2_12_FULL_49_9]|nr:MAG: multidrug transporter [Chlamydiae bacterium RIFCSPHIGHO2_12_FULL_49_9]
MKRRALLISVSAIAIGCMIGILFWAIYFRYIEYTDDAYVEGNQVYITPLHPGFVTAIHTDDTFLVNKGQPIVELDRTDSKIALERVQEHLAQTVRQVCEMFHQVFVYEAEIELKKAELIRDAQDYLHRHSVFREGGVSIEDYEHAIAALRAQYSSLEMTTALYNRALAAVQAVSIRNHPLVIAAQDQVRDAWVSLYRCTLYAPVDGLVAQRRIQVGMWTPAGQPLMSVIPLDQIWVNANYKETQLKYMRIGQKVDITADLWGVEHVFHGTIVGLPGGAGNVFSLLPPQNLSGNWIKIVQRLPVRVALRPEEIQARPLRLGLSCKAVVDTRDHSGPMVPDSATGSPQYLTNIFEKEEEGDREDIQSIIAANLDPALSNFSEKPLSLKARMMSLPPILKEAFKQDALLQQKLSTQRAKEPPQERTIASALFEILYRDYLK